MNLTSILKFKKLTKVAIILFLFPIEFVEAQTPEGVVHHSKATSRRRTAVVVSSATKANDQEAAAAANTTTTTTTTTAAPAAAPAATPAPTPAPAAAPAQNTTQTPASKEALLPIGTIATKLPAGCATKTVSGEQYYQCGTNYYKAAYQEGSIVYITVKEPK